MADDVALISQEAGWWEIEQKLRCSIVACPDTLLVWRAQHKMTLTDLLMQGEIETATDHSKPNSKRTKFV